MHVRAFVALLAGLATPAFSAEDPFIAAAGNELRAGHGQGEPVSFRGVNLGGWLVFEPWQCPMDSGGLEDDWSARKALTVRFGAAECEALLSGYQEAWITESDFDLMAKEGFNLVRLPFWYRNLQDENGRWREDAFARLDWAVREAWKRGIYTILDLHGAPGGQSEGESTGRRRKKEDDVSPVFWNSEPCLARTEEIWKRVARHFRGNPAVAAYDLLNEPYGAPDRETLWSVYDRLYRAVRSVDPDHVVSFEGCWGGWYDGVYHGWGWESLPSPAIYGWSNVLYQQHSYEWAWNDLDKQKQNVDVVVSEWVAHQSWGVPCLIGEFNCMAREEAWNYAIQQFSTHGMSWALWTWKSTHGTGDDSWGYYNPRAPIPPAPDLRRDSADVIREKWAAWSTETLLVNQMLRRALGMRQVPAGSP